MLPDAPDPLSERYGRPPRPASAPSPAAPGPDSETDQLEGLEDLEREIAEILTTPPAEDPTNKAANLPSSWVPRLLGQSPPRPSAPVSPLTAPELTENERLLRAEVVRLRAMLVKIQRDVAEHRLTMAGVSGQVQQVHSAINEIRVSQRLGDNGTAGTEASVRAVEAPVAPTRPTVPPSPPSPPVAPGPRALSAAPVFFLGPDGQRVHAQAFFTLGKGGALETFLTKVLESWEDSGFPVETQGGVDGFSLTLVGDPQGRNLKLLPSGMYLVHLGVEELAALEKLPPLVSSQNWPKGGGFTRQ